MFPDLWIDERVLPHKINTANLEHFKGVKIPTIPEVNSVDILIEKPHKFLRPVLEEREGARPEKSNYVLTRLGPIASGGSLNVESNLHHNFKINNVEKIYDCSCEQLKQEVSFLKNCLRDYEIEDELIQPSKNDEITRLLVEPNVKVVNNRYKIPVPMKKDVINVMPNNFNYGLERTALLRRQGLKNSKMKCTLIETFDKLISTGWLAAVDNVLKKNSCWYLPF